MKRSARTIFIVIIGIALFRFLPSVQAKSGCTCNKDQVTHVCGPTSNSCAFGYQPQCAQINSCDGSATSCTCVNPLAPSLGGCTCNVDSNFGSCVNTTNSCTSGYQPQCAQLSLCGSATSCTCVSSTSAPTPALSNSACQYISDGTQKSDCDDCAKGTGKYKDHPGVWTAIGCITTDPNNLLGTILKFGLGLAGGIAFLLILFGGLQIMTSAGNPEQLIAGRELISSAIIGLILILFSIFLLQFIGFTIIGIPGFAPQ